MNPPSRRALCASFGVLMLFFVDPALAQTRYDPGASDTSIKIGNTMPYSGAGSAWSLIGRAEQAYFDKINAEGGINGRKIEFLSYDDAYSPPKTVEQVRRLIESDEVLLLFSTFGVPTNTAIHKYVNARGVPHLFIGGGGSKWNDPSHYPWSMGFQPSFRLEGAAYGRHLALTRPDSKIAVLYQNDDYGKDILDGLKRGLGDRQSMIVAAEPYEISEPTIETRVVKLKASGADVFMNFAGPKFAAQAIRKVAALDWHPVHFLNLASASVGSVVKPAGLEFAQGLISGGYLKDATDPALADDEGVKSYLAFLSQYYSRGDVSSTSNTQGYLAAQTMAHVLKQAGDDLTRANVMRVASSIQPLQLDMLLPGIVVSTSPNDFAPVKTIQLRRFAGERWVPFGPLLHMDDVSGQTPAGQ